MKKILLGVLMLGLLSAAEQQPKPDDLKEKLKGTWTFVSIVDAGQNVPEEKIKGASFTFDGDKFRLKFPNGTENGTYKLDASQKPPHLNLTRSDREDETAKMIVQLDGDTLKLGGGEGRKSDRPKDFTTAVVIMTLKREKK